MIYEKLKINMFSILIMKNFNCESFGAEILSVNYVVMIIENVIHLHTVQKNFPVHGRSNLNFEISRRLTTSYSGVKFTTYVLF